MTGGEAAAALLAGAAAVAGLVAIAVVARNRARRRSLAQAEVHVRPILFQALDDGDLDLRALDALTPVQQRCLEAQARSLLHDLRGQDRETLARLLDRRGAVEAARRQTRSRRAGSRQQAGELLADAGSPAGVRDLIQLLADPDPKVRWSAARGLGRAGHVSALSPLLASLEGERALPPDVVADAVFQIRRCPVSLLRQGLRSRSVPTRAVTVELLGRFQALDATDDVIHLLDHDPSVEVRARAARSLGRMGSPRAVDPLLSCLDDGPVAMRAQAIWALGEIGPPQALPVLRAALLGPSHQLREMAAGALLAMGPSGVDVLAQVAAGDDSGAATAARVLASRHDLAPSQA